MIINKFLIVDFLMKMVNLQEWIFQMTLNNKIIQIILYISYHKLSNKDNKSKIQEINLIHIRDYKFPKIKIKIFIRIK
jgi:hypothetical protein